jgi:SAM-dependent methyltransferase
MEKYEYAMNYDDALLAELYDQCETDMEDVDFLKKLIGAGHFYQILECFSGSGRILIPLLQDGHQLTGIEMANAMSERTRNKIEQINKELLCRTDLLVQDVCEGNWGKGYDIIIIGNNALFELPSAEMQERCIRLAYEALKSGGKLFIDTNNWRQRLSGEMLGDSWVALEGTVENGQYGKLTGEVIAINADKQVMEMKRTWLTRTADGKESLYEYTSYKHPVTYRELEQWINSYDFSYIHVYGDYLGNAFSQDSRRVIFWAEKK